MTKHEMELRILELEKEVLGLKLQLAGQLLVYVPEYQYVTHWPEIPWGGTIVISDASNSVLSVEPLYAGNA